LPEDEGEGVREELELIRRELRSAFRALQEQAAVNVQNCLTLIQAIDEHGVNIQEADLRLTELEITRLKTEAGQCRGQLQSLRTAADKLEAEADEQAKSYSNKQALRREIQSVREELTLIEWSNKSWQIVNSQGTP
jgi:chromosome segregation ATPase